jgi:2-keto-4-pentenoate hydratase/2-oxohepta-3-ene-1,7-dioic acid hydratase in catechol pathway
MQIGRAEIDGSERVLVNGADGIRAAGENVRMDDVITGWPASRAELESLDGPVLEPSEIHWLPPVMPDKLICIGTNYRDHVNEMEAAGGPHVSAEPWPFSFLKPPRTSLTGHEADVRKPGYGAKLDWETELALVIGDGSKARGENPLEAIFGYSVLNDLSVRDYVPLPHALGLDALVAKGFDDSAPMGPFIVTADEIADPQVLALSLRVNGAVKQDSNTAHMIFGVREILAHLARVVTLSPGDVIATGTPAGVGAGRRPPEFLEPGDVVEAEVEGVGLLRTRIVAGAPLEPISM